MSVVYCAGLTVCGSQAFGGINAIIPGNGSGYTPKGLYCAEGKGTNRACAALGGTLINSGSASFDYYKL
ncbi:MAG: hypothetical protein LBR90_04840 [Elusimicrobiota bacterium]|nr:hypothetical protein [Elusimicrobiota bacterium]